MTDNNVSESREARISFRQAPQSLSHLALTVERSRADLVPSPATKSSENYKSRRQRQKCLSSKAFCSLQGSCFSNSPNPIIKTPNPSGRGKVLGRRL